MIVAIDGPSGSGKSSVSTRIAKALNLVNLNTGMIYRGVALFFKINGIEEEWQFENGLKNIKLKLTFDNNTQRLWLGEEDVTDLLMQNDMSARASKVSKNGLVRDFVARVQSELNCSNLIAEGRDITTVIFPHAEHKFFMNASYAIRAERRAKQLETSNELNFMQLVQSMFERDIQDLTRSLSPLQLAPQAIYINTDNKTLDEVTAEIITHIKSKT